MGYKHGHHEGKNWEDKDMNSKEFLLKKKKKLESILAEVDKRIKTAK